MTAPRPKCVSCGQPYGSRTTTSNKVTWPIGEPMPAYRGNGIVVKTRPWGKSANRATVQAVTPLSVNPEIRARQEAQIASAPVESVQIAYRDVWDGVTWFKPYEPFCTLRCALAYAQAAFKATGVKRKLAVALVGLAALCAASAAPAPARAGGVLLCNEFGCRSSPYFPPPVVAVAVDCYPLKLVQPPPEPFDQFHLVPMDRVQPSLFDELNAGEQPGDAVYVGRAAFEVVREFFRLRLAGRVAAGPALAPRAELGARADVESPRPGRPE